MREEVEHLSIAKGTLISEVKIVVGIRLIKGVQKELVDKFLC